MKTYSDFGIQIPYGRQSGEVKTYCPKCHDRRTDKRDKSLSVNLDMGIWNCHYCSWSGSLHEISDNLQNGRWNGMAQKMPWNSFPTIRQQKPTYKKPMPNPSTQMSAKALAWFKGRGISEATLQALHVTEGVEWMPQNNAPSNTVQFNYYLNGELINTKFRTGDKKFKLVSGARLIPYNIDAIKRQKECICVEGEIDALSFYEIGHHNVISVPNGANANLSYLDDFIEDYFDDKETIFIASDTDTKGVLLRDELLRRFGPERCRVLDYGEDCKDANEVLMKYGAEALEKCLQDAPEVKLDGVFTISDFEQSLDAIFENGLQRGFTVGFNNIDRLISFETKRLCIVTGVPGCLAGDTLVSMADGTQKPIKDVQTGDKVISYTKDYQRTIKEVVTKWISGKKEVLQLNLRNGMSIQPTPKHKFLTFDGWKPAGDIKVGDFLLDGSTETGASKHCDFVPRRVLMGLKNTPSYFSKYGVYVHMDEKKPRISRSNALACAKIEGNHKLENKLNCRWIEVKSVERKGIVSTFDLEVADTHNYLANNILLSNSGKSEFIDQITERLNIRYGWRFAYFSPENFPLAYHAAKLIEKFTGHKFGRANLTVDEYRQVKEHLEHNFFFIAPETGFSLDTILEKARFLVRRYGIKCLIIDPYNRLENEQGKQNETQYISGVLDKLTNFAQLNDVLVILMAHPVKMQKDKDGNVEVPSLYDISGSANFYNKADFGLTVHRHREENVVEVRVLKVKFRHLGETGSAFFRYNLINGRYVPCKGDGSDEAVEWDNSNHLITPPREETFEEISDTGFSGSSSNANAPKASSLPFGDPTDDAPF